MSTKLIFENNSMKIYTYKKDDEEDGIYLFKGIIDSRFIKVFNFNSITVNGEKYKMLNQDETEKIAEILKDMSPYADVFKYLRSDKKNVFVGKVITTKETTHVEFNIISDNDKYLIFGEPLDMIREYEDHLEGYYDFQNYFIDTKYLIDCITCDKTQKNLEVLEKFLDSLVRNEPVGNNIEFTLTSKGNFVNNKESSKTIHESIMNLIEDAKVITSYEILLNKNRIFSSKTKNPKTEEILGSLLLAESAYKRSRDLKPTLTVVVSLSDASLSPIRDKSKSRSKNDRIDQLIKYALNAEQTVENRADKAREIKMLGESPLRTALSLGGRENHLNDKEVVEKFFKKSTGITRRSVERETSEERQTDGFTGRKFIRNTGVDSEIYKRGTDKDMPHQTDVIFNKRKGNQGYLMPVEVYAKNQITEECSFGASSQLCGMRSPGFKSIDQTCGLCHCKGHNRSVCVCPFCKLINSHSPVTCPLIDARFFVCPDYQIKCTCSVGGICPQCIRGRGIDDVYFLVNVKTNGQIDISILAKGPIELIDELKRKIPDDRETIIVQNLYYLLTHEIVRRGTEMLDGAMTKRLRDQLETLITSEEGFEAVSRRFISEVRNDKLGDAPTKSARGYKIEETDGRKLF